VVVLCGALLPGDVYEAWDPIACSILIAAVPEHLNTRLARKNKATRWARVSSWLLYLDYGRVIPAVSTHELGELAVGTPD